jgi:hypothetical protein
MKVETETKVKFVILGVLIGLCAYGIYDKTKAKAASKAAITAPER